MTRADRARSNSALAWNSERSSRTMSGSLEAYMSIIRSIFLLSALSGAQALPEPLLAADAGNGSGWIRLFNGRNLEGFDTFLKTKGLNNDPEKVVSGARRHAPHLRRRI